MDSASTFTQTVRCWYGFFFDFLALSGLPISPDLLCWRALEVRLYDCAPAALNLRQTQQTVDLGCPKFGELVVVDKAFIIDLHIAPVFWDPRKRMGAVIKDSLSEVMGSFFMTYNRTHTTDLNSHQNKKRNEINLCSAINNTGLKVDAMFNPTTSRLKITNQTARLKTYMV